MLILDNKLTKHYQCIINHEIIPMKLQNNKKFNFS